MTDSDGSAKNRSAGSKLKKWGLIVGGTLGVLFVAIQFVPVEAMNIPNEKTEWDEPPEVTAILRRACFDCHSNEVRWPWYSRVAPASWLLARDVTIGRKAFNFSEWEEDEDDRQFDRESAWEQIEEGEMPPWFYIYPLHMDAKLSEQDLAILKAWGSEKEDEEEGEEDDKEKDTAAKGGASAASDEGE